MASRIGEHTGLDNKYITQCCETITSYHKECTERLNSSGLDTEKEDCSIQWTGFHNALVHGNDDVIKQILAQTGARTIINWLLNTPVNYDRVHRDSITPAIHNNTFTCQSSGHAQPGEAECSNRSKSQKTGSTEVIRKYSKKTNKVIFELPLSLAAAGGSEIIFRTLISDGADIHKQDSRGNNIIHNLVQLSDIAPKRAVRMFNCLLKLVDDLSEMAQLLHTRNHKKKKPIDLAAYMGLPEMLNAIISTEGVYKHSTDDTGYHKLVYYNVSEYERQDSVTSESILYHLTNVDEKQLLRIHKFGLLTQEPFKTWFETKFKSNRKVITSYGIFWVLFVGFFLLKIWSLLSLKSYLVVLILSAIITCFAIFTLLVEIGYAHENGKHLKKALVMAWKHKKYPVTFLFPYQMIQIVFCLTAITNIYGDINPCSSSTFINVSYALNAVCGTLSAFFFMQLSKGFGHLLITVQKMVYVTLMFSVMIFLTYVGYTMALHLLYIDISWNCLVQNGTESQTKTSNSNFGYGTLSESFYTTILLMFTVTAPADVVFSEAQSPIIASIIYLSLVIFIGIICLNLLIALMSQRMEEIDVVKDDILLLQRISIVLFFDERVRSPVMRCFFRCCHCCRRYRKKTNVQVIEGHSVEQPSHVLLQCRETFICDDKE
jgi:hypothetical protein